MSQKVKNKYVTFVSLDPVINKASVNIPAVYYDETGQPKRLILFRDNKTGEDVVYKFKFSRDKRHITIPHDKRDIYGESYVEFLRNHPLNKNSYLSDGNPYFKEMDDEKDASIAIDDFRLRNEAENKALALKGAEFEEVCRVLGIEGDPSVMMHKIIEFASRNPRTFLDSLGDPNRKALSLFRAAVSGKAITKKGFMYMYGDTAIGNDEERAVTKIASDPDLQDILTKALSKAGK